MDDTTIPKPGGVPRTSEEYISMYRTVASCNFALQIAATSLIALQYNILSVTKRFTAYKTMGNSLKLCPKILWNCPLLTVFGAFFKKWS